MRRSFLYVASSITSGILLWLAWPERGFTPLIFFALIPLLFVENRISTSGKTNGKSKMFGHFYLAMLTWNVLTTWWIYNSTDVGSFVAMGLNSLFMAVILQLFHLVKRRQGSAIGYVSLVLFWIAFEYLHYNWEISWPWLTLGNVFATQPSWVQWYEYTGVLGGSFWVLSCNLILYQLAKNVIIKDLLKKLRTINVLLLSSISILFIALPLSISFFIYDRASEKGAESNVVLIQPNIDPYNEKFSGSPEEQLAKILRLGATVADSSTDFFIAPETALPQGLWEESIEDERPVLTIRKFLSGFPKANMIIGLTSFKSYTENEKRSLTARKLSMGNDYYDVYNAAMMLSSRTMIQLYHKSKLVPGVEKMPYPKIFGFLEKYAIQLGGTSGSLGTQDKRINFKTLDDVKIAPAICYESIYGGFMSGYIRDTAEFIAVITNDGWWGNTPGYRQHMNYSRLLAISLRKDIARSANTGISCFINQRGDVLSHTNWWEDDALAGKVHRNKIVTFYARHGDYVGFIAAYLSIALLLYIGLKRLVLWF